ncbi:unnamed protein product [Arctogadus glacialis]
MEENVVVNRIKSCSEIKENEQGCRSAASPALEPNQSASASSPVSLPRSPVSLPRSPVSLPRPGQSASEPGQSASARSVCLGPVSLPQSPVSLPQSPVSLPRPGQSASARSVCLGPTPCQDSSCVLSLDRHGALFLFQGTHGERCVWTSGSAARLRVHSSSNRDITAASIQDFSSEPRSGSPERSPAMGCGCYGYTSPHLQGVALLTPVRLASPTDQWTPASPQPRTQPGPSPSRAPIPVGPSPSRPLTQSALTQSGPLPVGPLHQPGPLPAGPLSQSGPLPVGPSPSRALSQSGPSTSRALSQPGPSPSRALSQSGPLPVGPSPSRAPHPVGPLPVGPLPRVIPPPTADPRQLTTPAPHAADLADLTSGVGGLPAPGTGEARRSRRELMSVVMPTRSHETAALELTAAAGFSV